MTYKAILFAPDGDYVTDHERETIEDVWEAVAEQGSRWFFYPYAFVIAGGTTRATRRIVDTDDYPIIFRDLKGRTIKTAARFIESMTEEDHFAILGILV